MLHHDSQRSPPFRERGPTKARLLPLVIALRSRVKVPRHREADTRSGVGLHKVETVLPHAQHNNPDGIPAVTTPAKAGRIGTPHKWSMQLNEFRIEIVPTRAIKGQAVADFMAELIPRSATSKENWWSVHVDGSVNKRGCGVGVVVRSPTGLKIEHAVHFNFRATNNAAEYEALLAGIRLARALWSTRVRFYTDS